jgi:DNA-binding response OmpR family regulator
LRVLIVDDNRDAADSLALLLAMHRYDVAVAYDGESGLRAVRARRPDCVVSDIAMPALDGYALARAVRAEPEGVAVKLIALSAFADDHHARRAAEAGFDYRLTKAGDVSELLEVLRMIEQIKDLASQTHQLAQKNVELADQTRELLQEVKEEVKEVKQEVKELKQEIKDLKQERRDGPDATD